MAEQTQNMEAGAAWIKTDKNNEEFLSILLNGENYNAFHAKNRAKETSPDLNLVKFNESGESDLVGAIWIGETKNQRTKLTIKMNDGVYYTAVKRDVVEGQPESRADYTIFTPSTGEQS